jgi:small-conductance mechanosensitive channel
MDLKSIISGASAKLRPLQLVAVLFIALYISLGASWSQTQPAATNQPQKVEDLLNLLGDQDVQQWIAAQKKASPTAAKPAASNQFSDLSFVEVTDRIRRHIGDLIAAIPGLPAEIEAAASAVGGELMGRGPFWMILLFAIFVAAGFVLQRIFWHLTQPWRGWLNRAHIDTLRERLVAIATKLGLGIGYVLVFALGSIGAFLLFDWPPLTRDIVIGYLLAVVICWLARIVLEFLFSSSGTERSGIIPMTGVEAIFWTRRLTYAVGWFAFGWVTVGLLATLGVSRPSQQLVAYLLGLVLLFIGIEAIWRRPVKSAEAPLADEGRQLGSTARNWLWSGYFLLLWTLWVASAMRLFWLAVVVVGLPGAVRLARKAVSNILRASEIKQGDQTIPSVLVAVVERGVRVALILAAVFLLTWAWGIDVMAMAGQDSFAMRAVRGAFSAVVILLLADFVWHIGSTVIDRKLAEANSPGEVAIDESRRRARVRTLLPIVRNVFVITIVVVAVLMALSSLGVQIAPLIAGAGVVGVAIGFGAQTVVKDIISGFFYLLDDAFRVGEYIESGSFKGTVESFSLRSVKLRHHRGALYTVPFSELGTVQNQSRDWVIEKITVTVTYDSDVEKARKIVKKIGAELAEDPEFKASTIEPLKMQGIDSFGDSGIMLRMKLKTRPGEQFGIKRKALMMIKQAFAENGIKMAFPTVQIAGGGEGTAAAAAAAAQLQAIKKTAAI